MRGQNRILSLLKLQPEIAQRELSFMLDMRKQSLGELLAKLESRGLIARETSGEDHRAVLIKLTPEGATAAAELEAELEPRGGLADVLNEEERRQLSAYLARLTEAVEGALNSLPETPETPPRHGIPFGHGFAPFRDAAPRGYGRRTPHEHEHTHNHDHEPPREGGESGGATAPGCHNCPLQRETKIAGRRCPDCPKHH